MPPKQRDKKNKPHPAGWRWKNGAWRYRVPAGMESSWDGKKEFTLGKTEAEAYRVFAERMKEYEKGGLVYMPQLLDKYEIEVLPTKAPATQKSNRLSLKRLRQAFQGVKIREVTPPLIYQYRDAVAKGLSQKHYNLDHEVLSHSFTKAIEWGARLDHPMTGKKVVKFPANKRTRYVEDWELSEFLNIAPPLLVNYCRLKLILGQDKGDLLSIQLSGIGAEGITLAARKKTAKKRQTGRTRFFPFHHADGTSTGLREALEAILAMPRPVGSFWLFCTRRGQPYIKADGTTSGFDSIWQRTMVAALEKTKLTERFTEHDLRAKAGSDMETDQEAQRLLDHTNASQTRTYRRKAVTMPTGKVFDWDKR
ncbi:MAG: integrase [Gammaproteobacteria bacterium]|nr:integrase [Gammaproteobacteria bacterium]